MVSQTTALAVFHYEEESALNRKVMVEGYNTWMVELVKRHHLVDKISLVFCVSVVKELYCNLSAKQFVLRQVDFSPSSFAKSPQSPICSSELVTNVNRHSDQTRANANAFR
jgi:hypothetical protein